MERSSKFVDWNSQYYMDVIFPELIYGILIKCLPVFWVKIHQLSIILSQKQTEPREDISFDRRVFHKTLRISGYHNQSSSINSRTQKLTNGPTQAHTQRTPHICLRWFCRTVGRMVPSASAAGILGIHIEELVWDPQLTPVCL